MIQFPSQLHIPRLVFQQNAPYNNFKAKRNVFIDCLTKEKNEDDPKIKEDKIKYRKKILGSNQVNSFFTFGKTKSKILIKEFKDNEHLDLKNQITFAAQDFNKYFSNSKQKQNTKTTKSLEKQNRFIISSDRKNSNQKLKIENVQNLNWLYPSTQSQKNVFFEVNKNISLTQRKFKDKNYRYAGRKPFRLGKQNI